MPAIAGLVLNRSGEPVVYGPDVRALRAPLEMPALVAGGAAAAGLAGYALVEMDATAAFAVAALPVIAIGGVYLMTSGQIALWAACFRAADVRVHRGRADRSACSTRTRRCCGSRSLDLRNVHRARPRSLDSAHASVGMAVGPLRGSRLQRHLAGPLRLRSEPDRSAAASRRLRRNRRRTRWHDGPEDLSLPSVGSSIPLLSSSRFSPSTISRPGVPPPTRTNSPREALASSASRRACTRRARLFLALLNLSARRRIRARGCCTLSVALISTFCVGRGLWAGGVCGSGESSDSCSS